jgi:hypothetical protein
MISKGSIAAVSLALLVALASCRSYVGKVNIDGDSKPRFKFTGFTVSSLVVYRVPPEYLKKGIPLDALTKDNPDTQWITEGLHDADVPIAYGSVPHDMKETLPAKTLVEGTIYFVSTYVGTEGTGAFVGQYFRISNGQTSEFHDDVSLSLPRRTNRWSGAAVASVAT